ncbi:DUF4339 domain-containing protein [Kamptonema cortianum]|nr:DUF4339 domain-containing protein [Oscillatoria laete-virens]MDK3160319.1 DUF4339 domain-containing protein [Kamptonema cortianum]MDL5053701.1 DUF4339 domain-containing protein [Oscillatoria laete-virens NRMC-F 0139]
MMMDTNPHSYYVVQQGRQQGPFPEATVLDMLRSGQIKPEEAVWCEGMSDWRPAREVFAAQIGASFQSQAPPLPSQIAPKNSVLGWISIVIAGLMIPGWLILLAWAGIVHNAGADENSPVMVVIGLLLFAGLGLNVLGVILGLIGLLQKGVGKLLPGIGLAVNAVEILGMIGIMLVGTLLQ